MTEKPYKGTSVVKIDDLMALIALAPREVVKQFTKKLLEEKLDGDEYKEVIDGYLKEQLAPLGPEHRKLIDAYIGGKLDVLLMNEGERCKRYTQEYYRDLKDMIDAICDYLNIALEPDDDGGIYVREMEK